MKIRRSRNTELVKEFYEAKIDSCLSGRFVHWFLNGNDTKRKEAALKKLWNSEEGDTPSESTNVAVNNILKQIDQKRNNDEIASVNEGTNIVISLRRVVLKFVAVIIPLFFFGGVWLFVNRTVPEQIMIAEWDVPFGETENHLLADNSEVFINAGSQLAVTQDSKQRMVKLSGESLFKVESDETRPFVVKTEQITIQVLGTEFNVQAYPDSHLTTVVLMKGAVDITSEDGREWSLKPNQMFSFDSETKEGAIKEISNCQDLLNWTDGKVICEDYSMQEIFKVLERRFNVDINISPDLDINTVMKYTIDFDNRDNAATVMRALQKMVQEFDFVVVNEKQIDVVALRDR